MKRFKEFYVGQKVKGNDDISEFTGVVRFIYEEGNRLKVDVERDNGDSGSGKRYNNKRTWTTTAYRYHQNEYVKEKSIDNSYGVVPIILCEVVEINGENYV